jgi:hypothetical protein
MRREVIPLVSYQIISVTVCVKCLFVTVEVIQVLCAHHSLILSLFKPSPLKSVEKDDLSFNQCCGSGSGIRFSTPGSGTQPLIFRA